MELAEVFVATGEVRIARKRHVHQTLWRLAIYWLGDARRGSLTGSRDCLTAGGELPDALMQLNELASAVGRFQLLESPVGSAKSLKFGEPDLLLAPSQSVKEIESVLTVDGLR